MELSDISWYFLSFFNYERTDSHFACLCKGSSQQRAKPELNAGLDVKTARGISEACSTVRHFKFCNFERRGKPCHPILLLTSEGASCPCSLLTYRARCSGPRHVHRGAAVPRPSHLSAQNNCLDFVTSSREESKGDNFC